MINASYALECAMIVWEDRDRKDLNKYLAWVSNKIEKEAKSGSVETVIDVSRIHYDFEFGVEYTETLILIVEKEIKEYGYNTEVYSNDYGIFMKIRWI